MTRLRLISWNLHGSGTPRIDAVVELLQMHEPDVLALQEVRSGQAQRIAGLLRWRRPAWSLKHNAWWPLWWRGEGLALLSRHQLAVHPTVVLTPGVSTRSFERRILVPAEAVLEDRRVLVIDAHLSSGATDEARRVEQAEHLLRLLPESPPVVVAGDLNADPDRPPIRRLVEAGLVDAWDAAGGPGPGHTIPANAPRRRIDYVLAGPGVRVVEAAVLDDLGPAMAGLSDHRPVLAVLELEASPSQ